MEQPVRLRKLTDSGDSRGRSFSAPDVSLKQLATVRDMHVATILPGAVRGNHFHRERHEVIVVIYSDQWSLHWDNGPDTHPRSEIISGVGAALIEIDPLASHAIRNDGKAELYMVGLGDATFNPEIPDSYQRRVV